MTERVSAAQPVNRVVVLSVVIVLLVTSFAVLLPVSPVMADAVEIGYRGPSFSATGVSAPTGDKPQSKLWINDGSWWGALYSITASAYTIHELDWQTQQWMDTGVVLEVRAFARPDVLWYGTTLYVVAAGRDANDAAHSINLNRLDYNASTRSYSQAAGFPLELVGGGAEAVVMDRDTKGSLWITYTRNNSVYVSHSGVADDRTWIDPFVIPAGPSDNLTPDDISAVVSFNGKVGVMWSNQNLGEMAFAYHVDGEPDSNWSYDPALQMQEYADDHINLKSLQADSRGQVYAATKTSLNNPDDPLLLLLVLGEHGGWSRRTFSTVADNHTRPLVLVDQESGVVHMYAAGPCCGGGIIYEKTASLEGGGQFADGLGVPVISSSLDSSLNNVTSTKQMVGPSTGIVILASDDHSKRYVHNAIDLGNSDTIPPDTIVIDGPSELDGNPNPAISFSSNELGTTFECALNGEPFATCPSTVQFQDLLEGSHSFQVRAVDAAGNRDPVPARWTWRFDPSVVSVKPVGDATVDEDQPTTALGTDTSLRMDGDSGRSEQALLSFVVPDMAATISSVTLRVYAFNGSSKPPLLYSVGTGWDEGSVTWDTRPALGTEVVPKPVEPIAADGWLELDVSQVITGVGTYGFALATTSTDGAFFHAREAPSNRPHLVVQLEDIANRPPALQVISPIALNEGAAAMFTAVATDPDLNSVVYSLADGVDPVPTGATIDPLTGDFTWLTTEGDGPSSQTFNVIATDDGVPPLTAIEPVTLSIAEVNVAPTLNSIPPLTATEGETVSFTAVGNDLDIPANSLSYSLLMAPAGASIDPATGVFSWPLATPGVHGVIVRVSDDGSPVYWVDASTTITVDQVSGPRLATLSPTDDAYVAGGQGTSNFGTSIDLRSDARPAYVSYMKFDLTAFADENISNATLRLFTNNRSRGSQVVSFANDNTWTELTITYANRPTISASVASFTPDVSGVWVEVDVTATVASASGSSLTLTVDSVSKDGYSFASKEAAVGSVELVVEYGGDPVPDTDPPDTTISSAPPDPSSTDEATFEFLASEPGTTFECRLDSPTFTTCTSPATYNTLADGAHTFDVRASDSSGNVDLTPATFSWTIDTSIVVHYLVASADTYVKSGSPDAQSGSSAFLIADQRPESEIFIRFDLTSLTGEIVSARLLVWASNGTSNGPKIFQTETYWDETETYWDETMTWNTKASIIGTTSFADLAFVASKSWVEIEIPVALISGSSLSLSLIPQSKDGLRISSREDLGKEPVLIIHSSDS